MVVQKLGANTYRLSDALTQKVEEHTQHGRNLVKLDFPVLPIDPGQRRVLEIYDTTSGEWERFEIRRFAGDGRVNVQRMVEQRDGDVVTRAEEDYCRWVDLSELHYRWVL